MKKMLPIFLWLTVSYFAYDDPVIVSENPYIVTVDHFLSDEECDYLVQLASPHLQRSRVVNSGGGEIDHPARTSQGMFLSFHQNDPVVQAVEQRIADLTQFPKENGEAIQILRYAIGEEYKPHYDFFDNVSVGGQTQLGRGGQRVASLLVYLKSPEQGGETTFPKKGIAISPEKGKALLFFSVNPNGNVDYDTLHASVPVITGEKWVATRWIREGRFQ